MKKPAPLIVFDLDGTLIDTAPDLLDTLNEITVAQGLDPVDPDALRAYVGFGARAMLTRSYEIAGKYLNPEKLDRLVNDFITHYAEKMPGTSKPFEGLLEAMAQLKEDGFQFAVCTNKTEHLARKLLKALTMDHLFKAISGRDTFSVFKPHPDHLLQTIQAAGGTVLNSVMIGDTPTDFSTAKAAKIPVIAVEFGYCDTPLETYQPEHILSHYSELNSGLILSMLKR